MVSPDGDGSKNIKSVSEANTSILNFQFSIQNYRKLEKGAKKT